MTKSKTRHETLVRTHDGGVHWEAACPCGFRSPLFKQKIEAQKAAKKHG